MRAPYGSFLPRAAVLLILAVAAGIACLAPAPAQVRDAGQLPSLYVCPMHPDVQSRRPGTCSKCRMELAGVRAGLRRDFFFCPRHPGLTSEAAGTCSQCGAALSPGVSLPPYKVALTTMPADVRPGSKVMLRFRIFEPSTGRPVTELNTVHERPFHLFVVSEDLASYQHIHPTLQSDGSFAVETVLPQAGRFEVIGDFSPVGGWPQLVRQHLVTAGFDEKAQRPPAEWGRYRTLSTTLEKTQVQLSFDREYPAAATGMQLTFRLTDEATGLPVRDLQPYLGAWGHAILMSDDAKDFVHSHPTVNVRRSADRGDKFPGGGPTISFETFFPRPGRYRVWFQFQRAGTVITAPFDIDVLRQDRIALYDGERWSGVDTSAIEETDGTVTAMAVNGSDLYAAVQSATQNGGRRGRVFRWNGHRWSALGEPFNGTVYAVDVAGGAIYAGGDFTKAGAEAVNRVARWSGRSWTALGEGVAGCKEVGCSPAVYALATSGNTLYAGGTFVSAGRMTANGIARWNGEQWSALQSGVGSGALDGVVRALAVGGNAVYAGGFFKTAGTVSANNVAKWDGSSWSALGSGVGDGLDRVLALAIPQGDQILAAGTFRMAGSPELFHVARWSGQEWSDLGLRIRDAVSAIAVNGDAVYVGGSAFVLPSGKQVRGVIQWNGTWSRLGDGLKSNAMPLPVTALITRGTTIAVAGGPFVFPDAASGASQAYSQPR